MSKNKELASVADTQVLPVVLPPTDNDWMEGSGVEDLDVSDFKIPYLSMLQAMSPQTKPREPEYIQGATEGKIMHSLTKELYNSIRVLPCRIQKRFQLWEVDAKGKTTSLIRELDITEAARIKADCVNTEGKLWTKLGHLLVEKWQWFVIVYSDDTPPYRACITMKSSQIKNAKLWVSLLMADGGFPRYIYRLSAKGEAWKDNSWVGWDPCHMRDTEGKKILASEEDIAKGNKFKKDAMAMKYKLAEEPENNVSSNTTVM